MRSGICLFYLCALGGLAEAQNADVLYADRANLASASRAAEMWTEALKSDPSNFETAWKLARADHWLGGHAAERERRTFLEQGVHAGQKAAALEPKRPEGYFWAAANMGAIAESFGLRAGLKYRRPIKDGFETVLRLDPGFQRGSADRGLGRWYFKVPDFFGGSHKLAEEHLRASLKYNPNSTASHCFLAELLLDDKRTPDARAELQRVLDAPLDTEWAPEDRDFKDKARRLLDTLK